MIKAKSNGLIKRIMSVFLAIMMVMSFVTSIPINVSAQTKVGIPENIIVKEKNKDIYVSFKKVRNVDGYIINYSTSKKYLKNKTGKKVVRNSKKNKFVKKTIKGLKQNTVYYVRIRSYKKNKNKKTYSKWSKNFKIKTSKKANNIVKNSNSTVSDNTIKQDFSEPSKNTDQCKITFETNCEMKIAPLNVKKGDLIDLPKAPTKNNAIFSGWYKDDKFINAFDYSEAIMNDMVLYANWTQDTDNDKLSGEIEDVLKTDKSNPDTDGDGLSDYEEYELIGTDPLKKDSDEDGVLDSEEDLDEDGLTNIQELKYGTSCIIADTDVDRLSDYDEIYVYKTNPLKEDTDGDGLSDGDEVKLGLDPINKFTDGKTLDSKRTFNQKTSTEAILDEEIFNEDNPAIPYVEGKTEGNIDSKIKIDASAETSINENRAVVGIPIDVSIDSDKAFELKFDISNACKYDESVLKDYVICTLKDNQIKPLTTDVDSANEVIYASISESGTYFVIDSTEMLRMLGININDYIPVAKNSRNVSNYSVRALNSQSNTKAVTGQADIVFVIDSTGSMNSSINNVKKNINDFAEKLRTEYNVSLNLSLVDYKDSIEDKKQPAVHKNGLSNWYGNSEIEKYKKAINQIEVNGGGDNPETSLEAIEFSRRLDFRTASSKFVVLVTDAKNKNDNVYKIKDLTEEAELLEKDGICTSVITTSSALSDYNILIDKTNGIYADINSNFANELMKIADRIGEVTVDGSWVLLDDFQFVKLNQKPTPGSDEDTDKDGIPDIEELGSEICISIKEFLKHSFSKVELEYAKYYTGPEYVTAYAYKSNPTLKDTDGDMYDDSVDSKPRIYTITDTTLMRLADLTYKNYKKGVYVDLKSKDYYSEPNLKAKFKVVYIDKSSPNEMMSKDGGFGCVVFRVALGNGKNATVVGYRGTEGFDNILDVIKPDVETDLVLGLWGTAKQSDCAYDAYKSMVKKYGSDEFYITGHSLGGRLVLDALYKTAKNNEVKKFPVHSATFNGLGYAKHVYWNLSTKYFRKYSENLTHYYYEKDFVGDGFGDSWVYTKPGLQIKLDIDKPSKFDNHSVILEDKTLLNAPFRIKGYYSSNRVY